MVEAIRSCLKCGSSSGVDDDDPSAACPKCGAIFRKVEAAAVAKATQGDALQAVDRAGNWAWIGVLVLFVIAITVGVLVLRR